MSKRDYDGNSLHTKKFPGENLTKVNAAIDKPKPGDFVELFHIMADEGMTGILVETESWDDFLDHDGFNHGRLGPFWVVLCSDTGRIEHLNKDVWKCRFAWK